MATITNKTQRMALTPRREPYWLPLDPGRAIGFRRGPDTWIARMRTADHKQAYHALGSAVVDYPAAKAAAELWFKSVANASHATPTRGTVADALAAYIDHLRQQNRGGAADENEARFASCLSKTLAAHRLERATKAMFLAWRESLRDGRQNRSVNRLTRAVAAGLNYACAHLGHVGSPVVWTLPALSDDVEESGEAAVFLTEVQRDRLISKAAKPLRPYLTGLGHTGARPSELAQATVADFDEAAGSLTLRHRKGRPPTLKPRAVGLSPSAIEFFSALTRGRQQTDPLIEYRGRHLVRRDWSEGIRAAITAANAKKATVPVNASAYSFRHARISELLQIGNFDPLSVAQMTGTSLAMMSKYYFKVIPAAMRDKLAAMDAL